MRTASQPTSKITAALLAMLCLPLTGCKETQKLEAELSAVNAKMESLRAEAAQQSAQMEAMKTTLTGTGTPAQAAETAAGIATAEIAALDAQLKKAAENYAATETLLKGEQQTLETLRSGAPR